MIDIARAKNALKDFLEEYKDKKRLRIWIKNSTYLSCCRKCEENCTRIKAK